jgi:hypothetical protein
MCFVQQQQSIATCTQHDRCSSSRAARDTIGVLKRKIMVNFTVLIDVPDAFAVIRRSFARLCLRAPHHLLSVPPTLGGPHEYNELGVADISDEFG